MLYYRLEAYETAATYFRTVAANPAVPARGPRRRSPQYLDAIENGGQGKAVAAMLTTGIRWQSNANAGPSDPTIMLNGLPFMLNPGALGNARRQRLRHREPQRLGRPPPPGRDAST